MPYQATVIPVMIASPGDVLEERNVARDVIHEWNYVNSISTNVVLMPVGWETHSSPELSGRPQKLINDRVLEKCDLLIGIFWTRLGTPTGEAQSGSAEEIDRHLNADKPVMVYFSTAPVAPQSIDQIQFNALAEFRKWCGTKGLIETFENLSDFRVKFSRQLQIALNDNPYLSKLRKNVAVAENVASSLTGDGNETSAPLSYLSQEAAHLLLEATLDKTSSIIKMSFIGGRSIRTNGKTFGDSKDRRSIARWEHALDELVAAELIITRGYKGEIFEVTHKGFELVEAMQAHGRSSG